MTRSRERLGARSRAYERERERGREVPSRAAISTFARRARTRTVIHPIRLTAVAAADVRDRDRRRWGARRAGLGEIPARKRVKGTCKTARIIYAVSARRQLTSQRSASARLLFPRAPPFRFSSRSAATVHRVFDVYDRGEKTGCRGLYRTVTTTIICS